MSIAEQISRIQTDKSTIRAKLVELGMATNTANLDTLATAIAGLINRGAVNIEIKEGESYTIPAGYHNGSGVVAGIAGGGNYTLQAKTVTPTKAQQAITSDEGYYGLSGVTVEAIPDTYQDVTTVTATAGDVLVGKIIVAADGTVITGTMTNQGAVSQTLDTSTVSYTVPKGYHNGTGKVSVVLEEKSAIPTKAEQTVTPTTGKVLSKVTVDPIPDEYQDVSGVTAGAADVLARKYFVDSEGNLVGGTMPVIGGPTTTLNTEVASYIIPRGYHNGEGWVRIDLESKSATPTKSAQTISPSIGKVLSGVTVEAIPDAYQDVTKVTATPDTVLTGYKFVRSDGRLVEGTIANLGAINLTIDGLTNAGVGFSAGYTTGGTVSLTDDIELALAEI